MQNDEPEDCFLGERKNHDSHQNVSLRIIVACVLELTLLRREILERQGWDGNRGLHVAYNQAFLFLRACFSWRVVVLK